MTIWIKQLTQIGSELSKLVETHANEKYLDALKEYYNKQGIIVTVEDLDSTKI